MRYLIYMTIFAPNMFDDHWSIIHLSLLLVLEGVWLLSGADIQASVSGTKKALGRCCVTEEMDLISEPRYRLNVSPGVRERQAFDPIRLKAKVFQPISFESSLHMAYNIILDLSLIPSSATSSLLPKVNAFPDLLWSTTQCHAPC